MDTFTEDDRQVALTHLRATDLAAQIARAHATFDALQIFRRVLSSSDLYDWAFSAWQRFVDFDEEIPDHDLAAVLLRAAPYLSETMATNFASENWPDKALRFEWPDGRRFRWQPDGEVLTITYPTAWGIAEVMFAPVGRVPSA